MTFVPTLADVDSGASPVQLTITAQDGIISGFTTGGGVTFLNNGTATVTASATVAALQAQLTAIGDGVVPAQAAMALRLLLGRAGIPRPVAADWSAA